MLKRLLLLCLLSSVLSASAQTGKCYRYKDIIFTDVQTDKDLSYNPNATKDEKKSYQFDLYSPRVIPFAAGRLLSGCMAADSSLGARAPK